MDGVDVEEEMAVITVAAVVDAVDVAESIDPMSYYCKKCSNSFHCLRQTQKIQK